MLGEIPYHGIDPVLLPLGGGLAIRWYGLMYLVGFALGLWILKKLSRRGFFPLSPENTADFLLWLVVGVVLGGRLGYALFYEPSLLTHPGNLVKIWTGGLSFHGGLLGVTVATILYTRVKKAPFWRVGDGLALAITPGIFFVRVANFINGELYGRVAPAWLPWAMRFPRDPVALEKLREMGRLPYVTRSPREEEVAILKALKDGTWEKIAPLVPLRHPSQIYEALLEGVLLGVLLWQIYRWDRNRRFRLPHGAYVAFFLGGYGIFRFFIEFFRQPDPQLGFVLGPFSRGQELCFAMVLAAGAIFWWCSFRGKSRAG